jgi:DNA adenine methylase
MTDEPKLIREFSVKDRRSGAIGVRKVYSDRSHVDVMPMAITARKSGARENKSMNYPGGKGAEGVYQTIINQMPPHLVYIEPFLGGGAILRKKKPAKMNWVCEFDTVAFNKFAPGDGSGYHPPKALIDIFPRPGEPRRWFDQDKLPNLFLQNIDGLKFLRNYLFQGDQSNVLIYCDPPYLMDTRSSKTKIYAEEFHTREKHTELLSFLMSLAYGSKANIMISGYDHPLYNEMLSDWRKISFQGISRGGPRTEVIWMNYPEPVQLHDYRYLGADYREREQIARQTRRWIAKLEAMPVQRRLALISSIEDHFASADNVTNGDAAALPVGVIAEPGGTIAQSETPTIDVESDEPREIIVDVKRLSDNGDIARSLSAQQIINGKVAKPFQFNQKWYVGTGACGGGSKVKGWEYVDAYQIVGVADYSGKTYTYGQHISLPDDHPDRPGYNGLLVMWKGSMHVLVGPKLTFRQDLAAKKNGAKSKPQHDHSPSKKAMPAIAA